MTEHYNPAYYKRVYVAGAYNGGDIISSLRNMRRAMNIGASLFKLGFVPYVPHHDYHFILNTDGEDYTYEDFYRFSRKMLEGFEALMVVPHSEGSKGTQMEIDCAIQWNIPVFHDVVSMCEYFEKMYKEENHE